MWKNDLCLYFSIHVIFIFLLPGSSPGDQLWPSKQSWALHLPDRSFSSSRKKGKYLIYYVICINYHGWIQKLATLLGLLLCKELTVNFFFFSGWKIFKANHIASNVQNWKDKQHLVSDYKIKQTVKIYIACEWKNWNYR